MKVRTALGICLDRVRNRLTVALGLSEVAKVGEPPSMDELVTLQEGQCSGTALLGADGQLKQLGEQISVEMGKIGPALAAQQRQTDVGSVNARVNRCLRRDKIANVLPSVFQHIRC